LPSPCSTSGRAAAAAAYGQRLYRRKIQVPSPKTTLSDVDLIAVGSSVTWRNLDMTGLQKSGAGETTAKTLRLAIFT